MSGLDRLAARQAVVETRGETGNETGNEAGNETGSGDGDADRALFDIELQLLVEAIMLRYQHDFRHYARDSLRRRMRHAMRALGFERPAMLQERLLREPPLFAALLQYLTIQVSDLFRDPAYFRVLRERVVPQLMSYPSPKLWVAGCSRGEEAWSLAILLHEEGLLDRSIVYATDINPLALQQAEAGVYKSDRAEPFGRNYLQSGGPCRADRLLHHRLRRHGVRPRAEAPYRLRRPQPGHRRGVLRGPSRILS